MPDVRLPDGTIVRNVPEGTTRAQLMARVGKSQESKPTSFIQGVGEGIMQPFNNAARWLETGAEKVGIAQPIRSLGNALGIPATVGQSEATQRQSAAASPTRGSGAGRFVGNVAATLPIPGGVLTQGAIGGALLSDKRDVSGVLQDAALGAVAGKVGQKAIGGIARAVSPKVAPVVQRLKAQGVRMTPGQIMGATGSRAGRIVKGFEDKASSIPVVGDLITQARRRSVEDFNRAALNEPLKSIGKSLPKGTDVGYDAVASVEAQLGKAYDDLLPNLKTQADTQFLDDMKNIASEASTLLPEREAQLGKIIQSDIGKFFDQNGMMTGEALKKAESRLGKRIRTYGTSTDPDATDMAGLLREAQASIREMAARQNPKYAKQLRNINTGFAKFTRVQNAASKAGEGVFTPGQLRTASRVMDSSTRKGQSAKGEALMQGLANDAQSVLPSSVPDSGTAGRLMALLGGAGYVEPTSAILGGAAMLPYTNTGGKAAEWLLTGRQGAGAKGLADLIRGTKPVAGAIGAASTPYLTGNTP